MKDIVPGPRVWERLEICDKCGTKLVLEESDVQVGSFKADPNTYWFDGSATPVDRFFWVCPECGGTFIIPDIDLPELVKRDVRKNRNDGMAAK